MEYWKFKAKDKLMDYLAQKAAVENIAEEITRLESEACSIKSATSDASPTKGGGSNREDRLLSNVVHREELGRMRERAQHHVAEVERALGVLSWDDQHILDVMYISGQKGAVSRLADEYCLADNRSVYKRVDKALLRFTIALYGVTET